jgi:modification methylase
MENKNLKYPKDFLNKIICGDSIEVMRQIPDNSVDLVVTSPPYNLKNSTGNGMKANTKSGKWAGNALQNGYSHYDDNMPNDKYAEWQHNCLKQMYRIIKDDGAILYSIFNVT